MNTDITPEYDPDAPLLLTGENMSKILTICGYSQADFARALYKSPSYVSRILRYERDFLPFEDLRILKDLVHPDNFAEALYQINTGEARKRLLTKYFPLMLKVAGHTYTHFAETYGLNRSFVYYLTFKLNTPLRYIDVLTEFLGQEGYILTLQEVMRREQIQMEMKAKNDRAYQERKAQAEQKKAARAAARAAGRMTREKWR